MLVNVTTTCCAGGTFKLPKLFLLPFLTFFFFGRGRALHSPPFRTSRSLLPFLLLMAQTRYIVRRIEQPAHEAIGLFR